MRAKGTETKSKNVEFTGKEKFFPSYNCAPTSLLPVLTFNEETSTLEIVLMRWGLIPNWIGAVDASLPRPINARSEGITERPMFRQSLGSRRCLMPIQGFYEWKIIKGERDRQPYFIAPKNDSLPFPTDDLNKVIKTEEDLQLAAEHFPLFEVAGIYDSWKDPETGEIVRTFATITAEPSQQFSEVHDRMPVFIAPEDREKWLDKRTPLADALKLLRTFEGPLDIRPVSRLVSSFANFGPELVKPIVLRDPSKTGISTFFKDSPKKDPFANLPPKTPKAEAGPKKEEKASSATPSLSTLETLFAKANAKREPKGSLPPLRLPFVKTEAKTEANPEPSGVHDFFLKKEPRRSPRNKTPEATETFFDDEVQFMGEKKRKVDEEEEDPNGRDRKKARKD